MQTKIIQATDPAELKAELDLIIAADSPTFMHVIPTTKSNYVVIWA